MGRIRATVKRCAEVKRKPANPNPTPRTLTLSDAVKCNPTAAVDPNSILQSFADRSSFHHLFRSSSSSASHALRVLHLMSSHGFPPDPATADIALRSLCSSSSSSPSDHDVLSLISYFHRYYSVLPDHYTYNFIIKHFCKHRSMSSVYSLISDLRSLGLQPDLVTYTILIDSVCNSNNNNNNLREATRLLSELNHAGFKPDAYVYNTIMKGFSKLGHALEVVRVFNQMKPQGVLPDLVSYNTLIFGLSKSGRVKDAAKYLQLMEDAGHSPDTVTYTSLMNGMCREGNIQGALSLLPLMESKGCTPNACTYNTLLHGLCKSRLLDRAMEVYGVIRGKGIKLDSASYATFLRALCREARVADAYLLFDYAVDSHSVPHLTAYSTLETTLKWLNKARSQGLPL